MPFTIRQAETSDDLAAVATLFRDYATRLGIDLAYQDFETELATLPGRYAPPGGVLLLARNEHATPIGCAALRPLAPPATCEMKRLYVTPSSQGLRLGETLARIIIEQAASLGYAELRLDTLPSMTAAQALYRKLGFETIAPYYPSPIDGTTFMRRFLQSLGCAPKP